MITTKICIYIVAILILAYSVRSLIAGIRNENKTYWMTTKYDGTKEWLGDKYHKVWNVILGIVGVGSSLILFYLY
jgi:hypothetical protein